MIGEGSRGAILEMTLAKVLYTSSKYWLRWLNSVTRFYNPQQGTWGSCLSSSAYASLLWEYLGETCEGVRRGPVPQLPALDSATAAASALLAVKWRLWWLLPGGMVVRVPWECAEPSLWLHIALDRICCHHCPQHHRCQLPTLSVCW